MGFRFRQRIKLAPGINLNIGKRGVSSVSIGGNGLTGNIGRKGTSVTAGLPGTGMSYTKQLTSKPMPGSLAPPNQSPALPLKDSLKAIFTIVILGFLLFLVMCSRT